MLEATHHATACHHIPYHHPPYLPCHHHTCSQAVRRLYHLPPLPSVGPGLTFPRCVGARWAGVTAEGRRLLLGWWNSVVDLADR